MFSISGISSDPLQSFNSALADGSRVYFTLSYKPRLQMWFLSLAWGSFTVHGLRVCANPNLLEQYSNNLPFGILVRVADGTEPLLLNDFETGRVTLWVLNQADIAAIEAAYEAGS